MESEADRLASIQGLGGIRIYTGASYFWAIFDNGFTEQQMGVPIESVFPYLTARTSDASGLLKDQQLNVGDEIYRVNRLEQDGTGMTRVVLKR